MEALQIYKSHETPPSWAIREIQAGRLKGKSDINPQFRILALTEMFGLCGIGWYYEVVSQFTEKCGNGEVLAFVNIHLFIKQSGEWSKPILGSGGSSMTANEKNGVYNSDECFKMATTDAISVACKMLGIAGAIYSGSKYIPEVPRAVIPEVPKKPAADIEIMMHCADMMQNEGIEAARTFISKYSLTPAQSNELKEISIKYAK